MIAIRAQNLAAVQARLGRLPRDAEQGMVRGLVRAGIHLHGRLQRRLSGPKGSHPFWGVTGSTAMGHVGRRSGSLARSITPGTEVFRHGDAYAVAVGSRLSYAALLERGGTITASGKMLRVPTRHMQTAAGVDRLAGVSARTLPNTFIWPNKRQRAGAKTDRLWIARQGPSGRLELLYMLTRSVTIRARHPFLAARNESVDRIRELVGEGVRVSIERGR